MSNTNTFEDWDVIHSYTRKQAIADGVLVDVTDQAKFSGFRIPVAIYSGQKKNAHVMQTFQVRQAVIRQIAQLFSILQYSWHNRLFSNRDFDCGGSSVASQAFLTLNQ